MQGVALGVPASCTPVGARATGRRLGGDEGHGGGGVVPLIIVGGVLQQRRLILRARTATAGDSPLPGESS